MAARSRHLRWLLPLALYAAFLWRTPYSLKIPLLRTLDWIVPTMALATWLVGRWRKRRAWPRTALDLPLLAWLAVTLLAAALSTDAHRSLPAVWETFVGTLILWLLVDAVRHRWAGLLWRALYLVAAVVCIVGAVEFLAWYLGWPLLPDFQQGWPPIGGLADPLPPTLHRLGLALVNITALSGFIALLIPPALCVALTTHDRDTRLGLVLWLLAAGATLILAMSRGGFLALAASLLVLLLGATRSPRLRGWWHRLAAARSRTLLVGTALVAVLALVAAGFLFSTRLAEHSSGDAVRLDLWRSAAEIFLEQPLVGAGPGLYGTALRTHRDPLLARDHILTAHNLYLNTAAEMGIPGLLVGAWLLLALARAWWRRWRAESPGTSTWWRLLGLGAALAGLAAQSLVDTFVEPPIVLSATFFTALILSRPKPEAPARPGARRWPWAVALALLLIGAGAMAWDTWGLAAFDRSMNLARQGQIDEALAAAEQARARDPGLALYTCHAGYLQGLRAAAGHGAALKAALDHYQACISSTEVPGWIDYVNMAALLWQADMQDEARAAAATVSEQMPLEPLVWLNRGLWAEQAGDRDGAVEAYGWVLALDPELAGSPFWQQGDRAAWWDAIMTAGREAQSDLGGETIRWRWQVLVAGGRCRQVTEDSEAWLMVYLDDAEAMAWLGEALACLDRPAEALPWLDRALDRAPARARTYLARGQARMAQGQMPEAERDLRSALFLEPDPAVHLALARLAEAQGQMDDALEAYSLALRPLSLPQNYNLVLYGRFGWSALLPQVASIGYRHDRLAALALGTLLEERGEIETARQVYEAALSRDRFLPEVQRRLEELDSE
jgi:tetratricopeptide (TPR) repeat protein/O-antigen ligase